MSASPVITPALRWARSMPPNRAVTVVDDARPLPSGRPTSAWRPKPPRAAAVRSAASPLRSTTATDTPAAASRVALASPIPDPPPVTTATVPARSRMVLPVSFRPDVPWSVPSGHRQHHLLGGPASPYRAPGAYWMGADCVSDRAPLDHETPCSMRPIPVAFHVWFLEVHTYGIGLALTFWFGLRYTERRLRQAGYPWQWVTGMFVWVIIAAIVGRPGPPRGVQPLLLLPPPGPDLRHLAGGPVVVRGAPLRRAGGHRQHPSPVPRAAQPALRRPDGAGADGVLGHRPAPRPPADGGRGRAPDQPVVRDVLRRPGRQAPAGADLPGHRGLRHLRHPASGRAVAAAVRTRRRGDRTEDGDARARSSSRRPASCSGWAWCCGVSSGSSTSTSGSARTAISARCWSRGPGSPWPWSAWCSCSPASAPCSAGAEAKGATRPPCHRRPAGHQRARTRSEGRGGRRTVRRTAASRSSRAPVAGRHDQQQCPRPVPADDA